MIDKKMTRGFPPCPWTAKRGTIFDAEGYVVAIAHGRDTDYDRREMQRDAEEIVYAVNMMWRQSMSK